MKPKPQQMTLKTITQDVARFQRAVARKALQREALHLQSYLGKVHRNDGWENLANGLGRNGVDPRTAGQISFKISLRETDCESLTAMDPLAHRVVWKLPEDAIRGWMKFKKDDPNMQRILKKLQVKAAFKKAWGWARMNGGAAIYLNTGVPVEKLADPLDLNNIREIKSLVVFSRWELWCQTPDVEWDINKPNFGMPRVYYLQPRKAQGRIYVPIHHTHLIRFDGKPLGNLLTMENQFWSDSVLTSMWEVLRDYNLAHGGIGKVLMDFRKLVWKLNGLNEAILAGTEAGIQTRIHAMENMSASTGAQIIDTEDTFEVAAHSLQGVPDALRTLKERLQAATDMPHTALFNEGPGGGLNTGKGESEFRAWYDHVAAQQVEYLEPKLDRFLEVLFASKMGPSNGVIPDSYDFEFPPLWQLTDAEQADIRLKNAQASDLDIPNGLTTSREMRAKFYPSEASERPEADPTDNAPGVVEDMKHPEFLKPGDEPAKAGEPVKPSAPKPSQAAKPSEKLVQETPEAGVKSTGNSKPAAGKGPDHAA